MNFTTDTCYCDPDEDYTCFKHWLPSFARLVLWNLICSTDSIDHQYPQQGSKY